MIIARKKDDKLITYMISKTMFFNCLKRDDAKSSIERSHGVVSPVYDLIQKVLDMELE